MSVVNYLLFTVYKIMKIIIFHGERLINPNYLIITVMPTGKTQVNPQEELIKDLTDQIWSLIPYSAKRNNKITWVMVYNVVRKAVGAVGCVDTEKLNDYFDIRVIDTNGLDAIYKTLTNELSKYACVDNDKLAYDVDGVRAMTINYIMDAINECLRSPCTDADINELIELINANKAVLGMEYYRLLAKIRGLRPVTKAISEAVTVAEPKPIKPTKAIIETSAKPAKALVEDVEENWQLILRPIRRGVDSGSRVSDVAQENWDKVLRVRQPLRVRVVGFIRSLLRVIKRR